MTDEFHDILKKKIKEYVHLVYKISRDFPKEELYNMTSQLRRAALSVILNYIEGYARQRDKVNINSLEIAYGSLKESDMVLELAAEENFIIGDMLNDYQLAKSISNEIGAMLWSTMEGKKSN